jgi:hypothetical protein
LVRKAERKRQVQRYGMYRKIILKCVIKKYSVKAWTGFRGLRILCSSQALVKVVMSSYVTYAYNLSSEGLFCKHVRVSNFFKQFEKRF